jgi:hypothetical protein
MPSVMLGATGLAKRNFKNLASNVKYLFAERTFAAMNLIRQNISKFFLEH